MTSPCSASFILTIITSCCIITILHLPSEIQARKLSQILTNVPASKTVKERSSIDADQAQTRGSNNIGEVAHDDINVNSILPETQSWENDFNPFGNGGGMEHNAVAKNDQRREL
ncbi:hypothetical protein LINPERHAP1_LOCUS25197 [Linum perenne]